MRTKIIYILGSGHSGSTLLDLILGSSTRIESVGEVRQLSTVLFGGRSDNARTCTCGATVTTCRFWSSVIQGIHSHGIRGSQFLEDPTQSSRDNAILVSEVLRQSGKEVYAESTKSLARLMELCDTTVFDVYVLYIVRDGRAVAFSNAKKGRGFFKSLGHWATGNTNMLQYVERRIDRLLMVRYEDMAMAPATVVARVMRFVGEPFEEQQLAFGRYEHHNIFGNRMRRSGESEIVPDTAYLAGIGRWEWFAATIYVFRLLRRFGYPSTRRGAEGMFDTQ